MLQKNFIWIMILISTMAFANEEGEIKLNLGGMYVTSSDTSVRFARSGGAGVDISLEDQLGQKSQSEVFYMDGMYRFNDNHSITIGYFGINNRGSKSISEDIEWEDEDGNTTVISAGANVSSYFNIKILKADYGYSFYHNEDVELALTMGLHVTKFELGIEAQGNINGVPSSKYSESEGIVAPLPTLGFRGEYTIMPKKLFATYNFDYFFLSYQDYEGSLMNSTLAFEYRFTDSLGMGIGYDLTNINMKMDNGKRNVEFDSDIAGVTAFFTYVF